MKRIHISFAPLFATCAVAACSGFTPADEGPFEDAFGGSSPSHGGSSAVGGQTGVGTGAGGNTMGASGGAKSGAMGGSTSGKGAGTGGSTPGAAGGTSGTGAGGTPTGSDGMTGTAGSTTGTAGSTTGSDGSSTGAAGSGQVLPPTSCGGGMACSYGQMCDEMAGQCVCVPGFVVDGSACVRGPVSDPLTRSKDEVCAHFKDGYNERATVKFTPGPGGMCDPGHLPSDARIDAVRRWNMFRWLSGLAPAGVDESIAQVQQECARIESYTFGHDPAPDVPCYTAAGAAEASKSMIGSGYFLSAAETMDAYMYEGLGIHLAHRRISLEVGRDNINFGYTGGGTCARYGYGYNDPSPPPYTAFPNPGFAPTIGQIALWSLHQAKSTLPMGNATVRDETANVDKPVIQDVAGGDYNSFSPDNWQAEENHTYRVTVSDGTNTISYPVTFITCP